MFKRILLLLMAVLLLVPACAAAEESENLLENPGFEELGDNGLPVGWYSDAYLTREGISLFSTTGEARSGEHAAVVENLDMNDARFAQTVEVQPNTMYRLSGWVKAIDILDAGRGANLSVEGVYVFSESLYDTDGDWIYLETYGLTDADQTEVTVFVRVGGYSGESMGKAAFDDISLEAVKELPKGVYANAWFVEKTVQVVDPADAEVDDGVSDPFWPWLIVIALAYAGVCVWLTRRLQLDRREEALREAAERNGKHRPSMPLFAVVGLVIAFLARILTAINVDGYQVDVNCFTAWGNTMSNVGPAMFYQSNWCDYTPGYIYIMGLNGAVAKMLNGIVNAAFVHKLIPMICDLVGAWLIYRLAVEHEYSRRQAGTLAILFAFNPATFINSAAWCQVDSVLCVGLMLVAYFALHRKWAIVLPLYVLCILLKPQALMLGFLGLAAIVMELVKNHRNITLWKQMGIGLLISIVVALAIILPFCPNQESGSWLIDLYTETLGSYPYATVNTANLYFLAGANWEGIDSSASNGVCVFLAIVAAAWAVYTFLCRKDRRVTVIEPILTACTALLILVAVFLCMSWIGISKSFTNLNFFAKFRLTMVNSAPILFFGKAINISGCHFLIAAVVLTACIAGLAILLVRKKRLSLGLCEPVLMLLFCSAFLLMPACAATWTELGVAAMAMAFIIVLPIFIRSGKLENLPLCGAVIFILLYVFGIKMHERYLFPALFLLGMAYAIRRDRRTLWLLIGTSCVLFINEGIVLDNSLRLGSSMGHLNADNLGLAMVLSVLNVLFALIAMWTCHCICLDIGLQDHLNQPKEGSKHADPYETNPCTPLNYKPSSRLGLTRIDALLMLVVTAVYSLVTLTTLGSTKAPQNPWKSSAYDEYVYIDLGQHYDDFSMMYFCQVSYNNFAVAVSDDAAEKAWKEEYPAQMAEGMCFSWRYLDPSYLTSAGKAEFVNASSFADVQKLSGRYVRINAKQVGLIINELIFKDAAGNIIPGVTVIGRENENDASPYYSDPANLLDEQDSLEGEPSWWNSTYFDEIYHARTAYELLNNSTVYEWTHPPLGKIIMSWFIAIFGMTPFGWRFGGALCGILMLPAMYLLVKQLLKRTDMAFVAMSLMALDCMHLTQTQIATIDSYPVLFIILSYFFILRFMQRDIVLEDVKKLLPDLALSGFFMGCGFASKWIGAYAGAGLAVLFFWTCIRHMRLGRMSAQMLNDGQAYSIEENAILNQRSKNSFKRVVVLCLWCLLFFVAVPAMIYLLSYADRFADRDVGGIVGLLKDIIRETKGMLAYHGTPGLGMDHFFYSPWYEWPLMITPMYYASAAFKPEGMSYAIFCFGNPWVWVVGLAGIAYTVFRWAKGHIYGVRGEDGMLRVLRSDWDVAPAFILIGLLAQFLPWVLVPRGTYIYHYFASVPFLILGTTLLLHYITLRWPVAGKRIWIGYLVLCLIWFIILFPYASGITVSEDWLAFIRDYPFISKINNYWQSDFLVQLNSFLEKIPILPHVYYH